MLARGCARVASASSAARPSSAGVGPPGARRDAIEVALQLAQQAFGRFVPDTEPLDGASQREQRVAAAAGEQRLGLRAAAEHLVELRGEHRLGAPLDRGDARPALLGLHLQARALGGSALGRRGGVTRDRLELDGRGRIVRARGLELGAERCGQRRRRLAAQDDALAAAAQAVERRGRLLARAGRIGELLLGPLALGDERGDPLVEHATLGGRLGAACIGLAATLGEPREVEGRDRRLQAGDLEPELLGPLGSGRLERERPQALLHLVLEVAGALDLDADARELQLGAVAAALEAAEAGRLLDQLAPLVRLRVEHGLDTALRDDRAEAAAEPDVGEQLDEVDPADAASC